MHVSTCGSFWQTILAAFKPVSLALIGKHALVTKQKYYFKFTIIVFRVTDTIKYFFGYYTF